MTLLRMRYGADEVEAGKRGEVAKGGRSGKVFLSEYLWDG